MAVAKYNECERLAGAACALIGLAPLILMFLLQISCHVRGPEMLSPDQCFLAQEDVIIGSALDDDHAKIRVWKNDLWSRCFGKQLVYHGIGGYSSKPRQLWPKVNWQHQHSLVIKVLSTSKTLCTANNIGVTVICEKDFSQ